MRSLLSRFRFIPVSPIRSNLAHPPPLPPLLPLTSRFQQSREELTRKYQEKEDKAAKNYELTLKGLKDKHNLLLGEKNNMLEHYQMQVQELKTEIKSLKKKNLELLTAMQQLNQKAVHLERQDGKFSLTPGANFSKFGFGGAQFEEGGAPLRHFFQDGSGSEENAVFRRHNAESLKTISMEIQFLKDQLRQSQNDNNKLQKKLQHMKHQNADQSAPPAQHEEERGSGKLKGYTRVLEKSYSELEHRHQKQLDQNRKLQRNLQDIIEGHHSKPQQHHFEPHAHFSDSKSSSSDSARDSEGDELRLHPKGGHPPLKPPIAKREKKRQLSKGNLTKENTPSSGGALKLQNKKSTTGNFALAPDPRQFESKKPAATSFRSKSVNKGGRPEF